MRWLPLKSKEYTLRNHAPKICNLFKMWHFYRPDCCSQSA